MTARELLELAAKATCRDLSNHYWGDGGFTHIHTPSRDGRPAQWTTWNPLEDDGDALRLAVKLRIDIGFIDQQVIANMAVQGTMCDPYANTRRAIVRAAAAIGRTK